MYTYNTYMYTYNTWYVCTMYVCIPGPAHAGQVLAQLLAFNLGTDKLFLENTSDFKACMATDAQK